MKHQTPSEFHTRPVYIELVGAGATGSLILAGLVRLHMAIKELGHPYGMAVRCWDPDTVSAANIGRQLFSEQEIGQNKAVTLISRYNYHFGLEWFAVPKKFLPSKNYESGNVVVISAVDTRKSRASINAGLKQYYNEYLIDSGCGKDFGQVCIGNGSKELPYPWVIHPELLDVRPYDDCVIFCRGHSRMTRGESCGKRCRSCSPIDCGNLFGFLDRRGRRSLPCFIKIYGSRFAD